MLGKHEGKTHRSPLVSTEHSAAMQPLWRCALDPASEAQRPEPADVLVVDLLISWKEQLGGDWGCRSHWEGAQPSPYGTCWSSSCAHLLCEMGSTRISQPEKSFEIGTFKVGCAGSYFCFPISLPNTEILGIGVRGSGLASLTPVQTLCLATGAD